MGMPLTRRRLGFRPTRLVFALLASFVITLSNSTDILARDLFFRTQNYQLNYEECSSGSGSSAATSLEGSDNQEKVWNYLKSKGFTDEQAAAIMGNFAWESGDPTFNKATSSEQVSGGGGFGIAQWTGGRRTEITQAASSQGKQLTDLSFQLDYFYSEIQTRTDRNGGSATQEAELKKIINVDEATEYVMYNYEQPGTPHLEERKSYAKQFFEKYGSKNPNSISSSAGTSAIGCDEFGSSSGACGESGLIPMLKCYAWPEYKGSGFITPTDKYAAAVKTAQGEGRYVGGTQYPGIDCGGFVTTLLYDSGYETGYNYNAKGGNTVSQYAWTKANWETLGRGDQINIADLRPGDVANNGQDSTGHTFLYVGAVDGFEPTGIASASWDDRAPMAGHENPTQSQWTWFRKKG